MQLKRPANTESKNETASRSKHLFFCRPRYSAHRRYCRSFKRTCGAAKRRQASFPYSQKRRETVRGKKGPNRSVRGYEP